MLQDDLPRYKLLFATKLITAFENWFEWRFLFLDWFLIFLLSFGMNFKWIAIKIIIQAVWKVGDKRDQV